MIFFYPLFSDKCYCHITTFVIFPFLNGRIGMHMSGPAAQMGSGAQPWCCCVSTELPHALSGPPMVCMNSIKIICHCCRLINQYPKNALMIHVKKKVLFITMHSSWLLFPLFVKAIVIPVFMSSKTTFKHN